MIAFRRRGCDLVAFVTMLASYLSYGSVDNLTSNPINPSSTMIILVANIIFLTYCLAGRSADRDMLDYLLVKLIFFVVMVVFICMVCDCLNGNALVAVIIAMIASLLDAMVYGTSVGN